MKWISVKDKLPESKMYTFCIVALWYPETKQYSIKSAQYDGYNREFESDNVYATLDEYRVTHWIPSTILEKSLPDLARKVLSDYKC